MASPFCFVLLSSEPNKQCYFCRRRLLLYPSLQVQYFLSFFFSHFNKSAHLNSTTKTKTWFIQARKTTAKRFPFLLSVHILHVMRKVVCNVIKAEIDYWLYNGNRWVPAYCLISHSMDFSYGLQWDSLCLLGFLLSECLTESNVEESWNITFTFILFYRQVHLIFSSNIIIEWKTEPTEQN